MVVDIDSLDKQTIHRDFGAYFSGELHTSQRYEPSLGAARKMLADYVPQGYAKTRNHVTGNVSGLNPYITWGVFSLREVRDALKAKMPSKDYQKFVNELAWKQYFREVFMALGDRVYTSLEPYKYPTKKQEQVPEGLAEGKTGLRCIDSIVEELKTSGYLHNHKRMWFAAYWVHYANVEWWQGEWLFYRYLLDGEPGPNALSWQWVASTFAHKPYYFNADNMRKFGHAPDDGVAFDDSYEALSQRFFKGYGQGGYAKRPQEQPAASGHWPYPELLGRRVDKPLVLLHAERLSDRAEVLSYYPDAPVLVFLDAARFESEQPSFMRFYFALMLAADLVKCLRQAGRQAELLFSDTLDDISDYAQGLDRASLVSSDSWHPDTWELLAELAQTMPLAVVEDKPLAQVAASLRSFSSYWKKAERPAFS